MVGGGGRWWEMLDAGAGPEWRSHYLPLSPTISHYLPLSPTISLDVGAARGELLGRGQATDAKLTARSREGRTARCGA